MPSFKRRRVLEKELKKLRKLIELSKSHPELVKKSKIMKKVKILEIELNDLISFHRRWVNEEFQKTIIFKEETQEVTFTVVSTGEYKVSNDEIRWLLCFNPNTGNSHYIKLIHDMNEYTLDEEWMERVKVIHNWEESWESVVDSGYDMMPCDENPEDCGVTCFNCSRGN